jgi:biotin carboxyl carrier protein
MKLLNLIGWLALVGIIFGASIAIHKQPPPIFTVTPSLSPSPVTPPTNSLAYHHKITVKIASLADLKIKPGDTLDRGTILCDYPQEKRDLQTKQQQLEAEIAQLSLPIPAIIPPPPIDLASAEIALRQAKLKLEQLQQTIDTHSGLQFRQIEFSEVFETEKVRQLSQLQERQHNAHLDLEAAIARFNEAKSRSQQQQYEYSLRLAEYQNRRQRQQYEVNLRKSQLQTIEDKLQNSVVVRSPYSGKVHRIKVIEQRDRQITVEIILLINKNQ